MELQNHQYQIDRVTAPILNYFLTSTPLDSDHLFFSLCSLYITMTTKNTTELNNHIINVINLLKKWKKRVDVDAILTQFIKINDCVDINIDFFAAHLNYFLIIGNIIVKKNITKQNHIH